MSESMTDNERNWALIPRSPMMRLIEHLLDEAVAADKPRELHPALAELAGKVPNFNDVRAFEAQLTFVGAGNQTVGGTISRNPDVPGCYRLFTIGRASKGPQSPGESLALVIINFVPENVLHLDTFAAVEEPRIVVPQSNPLAAGPRSF